MKVMNAVQRNWSKRCPNNPSLIVMSVHWRIFHFNYQIPREHQRQIPLCPRCFASLSCGLLGLEFGMSRLTLQFQGNDSIKVRLTYISSG